MLKRLFGLPSKPLVSGIEFKISANRKLKKTAQILSIRRSDAAGLNKQKQYIQDILFNRGIKRFNAVPGGIGFLSVSENNKQGQNPFLPEQPEKSETLVRLWSHPESSFPDADNSCSQLQITDELNFTGNSAALTQSPDMAMIAVCSENIVGIYEIKSDNNSLYFKLHSSYILPENSLINKVTFHAGSAAIKISTSSGELEWVEIRTGTVNRLEPKNHDRLKVPARTVKFELDCGFLQAVNA